MPAPGLDLDALTRFIFATLRDELLAASDGFTAQSDLVDAGLDSLAATQLLLAIEEHTGVWVDESVLTPENLASSEALARCVLARVAEA
ncbi:MAG: phosphopantetheine-binding protein [Myxococcota bacterium]